MNTFLKVAGVAVAGYIALHFVGFVVGKIVLVATVGAVGYMAYRAIQHKKRRAMMEDMTTFRSTFARDDEKEHQI